MLVTAHKFKIIQTSEQKFKSVGYIGSSFWISFISETTVYLKDMEDFQVVNSKYGEFFLQNKPARACVEVARLPKDVRIEIDAVALI